MLENAFTGGLNAEHFRTKLILFYIFFSFAELCHLFADQLIKKNTPLVGLSPLLKAISKIQTSEKCLTSVHADVARLALASKCFTRPVLSLLEVNYNEISREATANPKNLLLFFYYGGMISASIKVKIAELSAKTFCLLCLHQNSIISPKILLPKSN